MKHESYSPLYDRLGYITTSGIWENCQELAISIEAFNGYTSFHLRLPANDVRLFCQKNNTSVFRFQILRDMSHLDEMTHGMVIDSFSWDAPQFVRFDRTTEGLYISFHIDDTEASISYYYDVRFRSLGAQRPLAERIPFNRIYIQMTILWPPGYEPASRLLVNRSSDVSACWTKGNYSLAFPSRNSSNGRTTTIFFPPENKLEFCIGFQNDIRHQMSDVFNLFSTIIIMHVSVLFLMYYQGSNSETDLMQAIGPLLLLCLPLYSSINAYIHISRHTYYSKLWPFQYLILTWAIPYILLIGTITLFALAKASKASICAWGACPTLTSIHWFGLCFMSIVFMVLYTAYRTGFFGYAICDNHRCGNRIFNRFSARTCSSTGRVFCSRCEIDVCDGCVGNELVNNFWLIESPLPQQGGLRCLCRSRFMPHSENTTSNATEE